MDRFEPTDAIVRHLDRILGSATFQGAVRSQALLRFLVQETVQGRSDRLKEYTLGAEALGKGEGFDPRTDPIVRAEASRLRTRLERYYGGEGSSDDLVIQLPKGTYVPQFRSRQAIDGREPTQNGSARRSRPMMWFVSGILLLASVAAALWARPRVPSAPSRDPAVLRLDADLGGDEALSADVGTDVVLSPDGTRIVFATQGADGTSHLNTRRLDQLASAAMIGTEGARGPFFSPDGQWVAFWAGARLKKIAVAGGPPQVICDAPDLLGGSWGDDGNIVAAFSRTQLSRVPSSGGSSTVIADFSAASVSPRWPQVLPGSKRVLFTAIGPTGPNTATVDLLSLPEGATRILVRNGTYGRYLEGGYLTYVNQGTLFAVRFSPDQVAVATTPTPILDDVAYSPVFGFAEMDASRTGTLVYRRSAVGGQFIVDWMDAAGKRMPLLARPGQYTWPRLSPDGQRLAVSVTESGSDVVLVHEIGANTTVRLTALNGKYGFPLWTPDGKLLVVGGANGLAVIDPAGTGQLQPLVRSDAIQIPWSFSPDGHYLAYHEMSRSNGFDLWTIPVQTRGSTLIAGQPRALLQSPNFEVYPAFSPDGRWLAYSSNETGTWEVYAQAFPAKGTRVRASTAGGRIPLWVRNAQQLVYETDQHTLMVLPYTVRGDTFVAGRPKAWSPAPLGDTGVLANFDVSADGRRVAALMPAGRAENEARRGHATFILNFGDLVRRQVESAVK